METEETRLNSEIKEKIVPSFSHFMARVAKYEELVAAGNRFLDIFRQTLDFIRRPSIDNTSQLFENLKISTSEKIVYAINLKTSSGELEKLCTKFGD
ncbi:unnamed protein product [Lactuca virosa]|uniref:DUF7795 domain-containing protein n=1 Tax=Lactuca virosa TaxID=75947 RepID=A0AAU9PLU5_9ASTR|nr:unnamed protein product [Lactuca virosa]